MSSIKVFSPATVSNVACGFDILGFPLESIGDEMIVTKSNIKGITITNIEGYDLPYDVNKNVAGISALAMLKDLGYDGGFDIEIFKNIKPGSGIGSSGASSVSSVFAINELLGNPYSKFDLIRFAMKGEELSSASMHADNVAPAILGGFNLVKSISPLEVLQIPTPSDLCAVIIHPQIEIKTSDSRSLLPSKVLLSDATKQLSSLGSLVHALHLSDYKLIGSCLKDYLIEPHRSKLIPCFDELKTNAIESGALGCSISGSGPSVFALTKGLKIANKVEKSFSSIYEKTNISYETYVSKISSKGVSIIN
jgi:homoserine kinase